jgi:hypothetical protein
MSCRTSRISAAAAAASSPLLLLLLLLLPLLLANRLRLAVLPLLRLALQAHKLKRFCTAS